MAASTILMETLGSAVLLQVGPPGGCAGGGGGGSLNFLLMMVAMFAIFYFLLIRPQQKRAREHQDMLKALKKGDRVITNGGVLGTITGTSEKFLTVEISEKVRIRVLRSHVAGREGDADLEGGKKN